MPRSLQTTSAALAALAAATLLATNPVAAESAGQAPRFNVKLTVVPTPDKKSVAGLDVVESINGVGVDIKEPVLELPHVVFNVPTSVTTMTSLQAVDDEGPVALEAKDVGEEASLTRQWYAGRAVKGTLRVSFRVPTVAVLAPRGPAPPIELRVQDNAVSGSGATFLLRPPKGKFRFDVTWDVSAMGSSAVALSSLDGLSNDELSADTISAMYVMAGQFGRTKASASGPAGFTGAWQGTPAFDAGEVLAWTKAIYGRYLNLFSASKEQKYTVFLRPNPVNPGGGYGLHQAFIATFGKGTPDEVDDLKSTLAHEMFHTFQPMVWTPSSAGGALDAAWFDEGIAVFYQVTLPYRYRMVDTRFYLNQINYFAGRYYTNKLGATPNSEVPGRFWEDTRIRTLPYDRGFLYFAAVDQQIREKSGGKRSLDDLMLALKKRQESGTPLSLKDWETTVVAELGPRAADELKELEAGRPPLPPSSTFGECVQRVQKQLRRYELGFTPKVLTESPRIVRGLIPGSNAQLAGVQDGDEITAPVGQDYIQGQQDGVLTLKLRRDGQERSVSYTPRGESVSAWQWERKPGSKTANCALTGR